MRPACDTHLAGGMFDGARDGRALLLTEAESRSMRFSSALLEAALHAALGRDSAVARAIEHAASEMRVARGSHDDVLPSHLVEIARVRLRALRGDHAAALATLTAREEDSAPRSSVLYLGSSERLLRAQLLRSLGRARDALRWLATIPEDIGADAAVVPAALLFKAHVLLESGDSVEASRAAGWALRYWRDSEASEIARVDEARRLLRGTPGLELGVRGRQ